MGNWTRTPRLQTVITLTGNGKDNRTFAVSVGMMYNGHSKQAEVKMVSDKIRFETFVDAQGTAFQEYLSTVIAKLPKTDKDYRSIQDKIENIYKQYPKVMDVFDTEKAAALTEQECAALIQVVGLQNQLVEIEMQSVYFRGCYDSVGYLRKAGIL